VFTSKGYRKEDALDYSVKLVKDTHWNFLKFAKRFSLSIKKE